jgi:hypothetical protein
MRIRRVYGELPTQTLRHVILIASWNCECRDGEQVPVDCP